LTNYQLEDCDLSYNYLFHILALTV